MSNDEHLGFIGLGIMGGRMATSLLNSGFTVNVFGRDRRKLEPFEALGARVASSPKEVAERSKVILSSLPDPSAVREVYLGSEGVLEGANPGSFFIDMSTIDPNTSRCIYKAASEKGIKYLDAPVSGGPKEAETGKLVITVGGDKDAFEECKHILGIFGSTIHYAGPSGSGNVVKLVNQMMSMGNVLIAAEALVLGVKAGMDGETLFNILRTSGGRSHHLEKRFPNALCRNFDPGFTTDLAKKDLSLALDMARCFQVPAPAASLVHQLYCTAGALGEGQKDCVSVIKMFESWAGVTFEK